MLLLYIIVAVYIVAINLFSFIQLKEQKKTYDGTDEKMHGGDGKLLLYALLGGALGIFISMFILKYGMKNIILMVFIPIIAAINIYFFVLAFRSGFTFFILK